MFYQTALSSLDSYKLGHAEQYPEGTTKVYSNFTPRNLKHLKIPQKYVRGVIWVGMQAFLQKMNHLWKTTFFDRPIEEVVEEAVELFAPFCGPNGYNTEHIRKLHATGYLPLEIKMLPEGSIVNAGVPVFTITNTVDHAYWLPNMMETWLSSDLWMPSTSATIAAGYREIIEVYARMTGGSMDFVTWQGHDFSLRGMSTIEAGALSGLGHGLIFNGSDNVAAAKLIRDCYRGKETFVFGSVPATEHSVMCAGGKESERATFERLMKTYAAGVVSIVSDTWNFWDVVRPGGLAESLKDVILNRQADPLTGLSKVVFRPDSGDPVRILCGYKAVEVESLDFFEVDEARFSGGWDECVKCDGKYYIVTLVMGEFTDSYTFKEIPEWVADGAVVCLDKIFGHTMTDAGYKTLNSKVGLIYGDSITPERCENILRKLADKGYASDNVVFGLGSYTFQYNTRDSLGFAMKATYVEINGVGYEIFKDPATDDGVKKSARGLLQIIHDGKQYVLKDRATIEEEENSLMQLAYLDGVITVDESYADIRNRLGYINT